MLNEDKQLLEQIAGEDAKSLDIPSCYLLK